MVPTFKKGKTMKDLINIVRNQLDPENEKEFQQILKDVTVGGADAGFPNFIYHKDTVKFSRDNIKIIMNQLTQDAQDLGEDPLKIIQDFNCLNYSNIPLFEIGSVVFGAPDDATINDGIDTQIYNALAWYALETVAHYYDN